MPSKAQTRSGNKGSQYRASKADRESDIAVIDSDIEQKEEEYERPHTPAAHLVTSERRVPSGGGSWIKQPPSPTLDYAYQQHHSYSHAGRTRSTTRSRSQSRGAWRSHECAEDEQDVDDYDDGGSMLAGVGVGVHVDMDMEAGADMHGCDAWMSVQPSALASAARVGVDDARAGLGLRARWDSDDDDDDDGDSHLAAPDRLLNRSNYHYNYNSQHCSLFDTGPLSERDLDPVPTLPDSRSDDAFVHTPSEGYIIPRIHNRPSYSDELPVHVWDQTSSRPSMSINSCRTDDVLSSIPSASLMSSTKSKPLSATIRKTQKKKKKRTRSVVSSTEAAASNNLNTSGSSTNSKLKTKTAKGNSSSRGCCTRIGWFFSLSLILIFFSLALRRGISLTQSKRHYQQCIHYSRAQNNNKNVKFQQSPPSASSLSSSSSSLFQDTPSLPVQPSSSPSSKNNKIPPLSKQLVLTNPITPYKHLLDKTSPHLHDLIRSLQSLPTGLHLSLSAHTSLALATVIESLATARFVNNRHYSPSAAASEYDNDDDGDEDGAAAIFDATRVAGSLRDLSGALNAAADGIVGVRSEGFFSVRGVVRVWGVGVERLEGFLEYGGDDAGSGIGGRRRRRGIDGRVFGIGKKEIDGYDDDEYGDYDDDNDGGGTDGGGGGESFMCCGGNGASSCGSGTDVGLSGFDFYLGLIRAAIERLIVGFGFNRGGGGTAENFENQQRRESRVAKQQREWRKNVQQLSVKMLDVLEETDGLLQALETSIFYMLERTSIVHAIWQGANGVAHRERQKILSIAQDLRSDLEVLKSQQQQQQQNPQSGEWIRILTQWMLHNTTSSNTMNNNNNHHEQAKATERMLRRVEDDMDMLGKVVSSLKDIAPGVIEISHHVKEMRVGVQKFRGDLKAAELLSEGSSWAGWRTVAREGEKDVETMRVREMKQASKTQAVRRSKRLINRKINAFSERLPFELMERILELIPFPGVCKLRLVSKIFDTIINTDRFARLNLSRIIDPNIVSEAQSAVWDNLFLFDASPPNFQQAYVRLFYANVTEIGWTRKVIRKLSPAIGLAKSLTSLLISNSLSQETTSWRFPEEMGHLVNLRELNLIDCGVTGPIPDSLCGLSKLQVFHLCRNETQAPIPTRMGTMTELQELALHGSRLTGTIPVSICSLINVKLLDLCNNQLTGRLPDALGDLMNLESLNLSRNQLAGLISAVTTPKLSRLRELRLNQNHFSGPISSDFGAMLNLVDVDLSANRLSGAIPETVTRLNRLEYLNLSVNCLTGCIPESIGLLASLHVLHLQENKLGGRIPESTRFMLEFLSYAKKKKEKQTKKTIANIGDSISMVSARILRTRILAVGVILVAGLNFVHVLHNMATASITLKTETQTILQMQPIRILYHNRHSGCHNNLAAIIDKLNENHHIISLSELNPELFYPAGDQSSYGMEVTRAQRLHASGFVRLVCNAADILVLGDTLPDARPFLQSLVLENEADRCAAKIDAENYHELIWNLTVLRPPRNLYWVVNNPFEPFDLAYQALAVPPKLRTLRPIGFSDLPARKLENHDIQTVATLDTNTKVFTLMDALGIKFKVLGAQYGGPKTLARYKAFVEFPYQVSTIKLYENLRRDFLVILLIRLSRAGDSWPQFMDYYHPSFKESIIYFKSFDHLKELLSSNNTEFRTLSSKIRRSGPKTYQKIADESVQGWYNLISEMEFNLPHRSLSLTSNRSTIVDFSPPIIPPISISPNQTYHFAYQQLAEWKVNHKLEISAAFHKASLGIIDLEFTTLADQEDINKPGNEWQFWKPASAFRDIDQNLILLQKNHTANILIDGAILKKFITALPGDHVRISPVNYMALTGLMRSFHIVDAGFLNGTQFEYLKGRVPQVGKVAYQWAFSGRVRDIAWDGIVMVVATGKEDEAVAVLEQIRTRWNCVLPAEIFPEDDELEQSSFVRIKNVSFGDFGIFKGVKEEVSGSHRKPFAILASSFKRVIFIDSNVILLQTPEKLLQKSAFLEAGALFFRAQKSEPTSGQSRWIRWFMKYTTSNYANTHNNRFLNETSSHEMDENIMVFDKTRTSVVHGLLATSHLNLPAVRNAGLDSRYKDSKFWIAFDILGAPYQMIGSTGVGIVGTCNDGDGSCFGLPAFVDEEGHL
ncbi:hypothetical protein HK100_007717, partial [Physocladia obscura]